MWLQEGYDEKKLNSAKNGFLAFKNAGCSLAVVASKQSTGIYLVGYFIMKRRQRLAGGVFCNIGVSNAVKVKVIS